MGRSRLPVRLPGNEVQLFVQTHGMVHLRNVQSHSSLHTTHAMQDRRDSRAHALRFLADLGLSLPRDLMANPMMMMMMMMTGANGHIVAIAVTIALVVRTVDVLSRPQRHQDAILQLRTAGSTFRRTRLASFSFVFALRHHRWAAIFSCFAQALRWRKSPPGSTMSCTTPFLVLLSWSIQTQPNGSSLGSQCTAASPP